MPYNPYSARPGPPLGAARTFALCGLPFLRACLDDIAQNFDFFDQIGLASAEGFQNFRLHIIAMRQCFDRCRQLFNYFFVQFTLLFSDGRQGLRRSLQ